MSIKQTNPVSDYYYNILAMVMTHDSLVRFDDRFRPVPQLAESWDRNTEGTKWTFRLIPNAVWHDGLPVTPEDVRFTFEYLGRHNVSSGWLKDWIDGIDTRKNEVVFRLKRPYSSFLINAGFVVRILPRHIWQKVEDPRKAQGKELTIGSGPFLLKDFDQTAGVLRFQIHPQYHGTQPRVREVEYRMVKTTDLLVLALQKGEVDTAYHYAAGIPAPYLKSIERTRALACLETDSMGIPALLGFNQDHALLRDVSVRRAVALAINYRRVNESLMDGKGTIPGPGLVPPIFPYYLSLPAWEQDLEQSRALLQGRGLVDRDGDGIRETPEGNRLHLRLLARSDLWADGLLVRLLTQDLEAAGIRLEVLSADLSTWQALLRQGRYDLILFRTTPWGMVMHGGYGTGYFDSRTSGGMGMCRVTDPDFFRICDKLRTAADPESQGAIVHELQHYYARALPAVALSWGKSFFPYRTSWKGFQISQMEGGLANRFSWQSLSWAGAAAGKGK